MLARLTARVRLTLLYTVMVLAAGCVMTALTYVLMRRNLTSRVYVHKPPRTSGQSPEVALPKIVEIAGQARDAALAALLTQAGVALAVVTVLAAVVGRLVAARVLRPVRAMSATAQRLSAENLHERVPVGVPADELATLALTVNGMLDRIQEGIRERDEALESQRMFTANAAHELRTPLATMRTAVEVTLDADPDSAQLRLLAKDIVTAVEHSRRTLDGLLVLARSQAGPFERQRLDLADIASRQLRNQLRAAAEYGVTVTCDLRAALVEGEPVLLERMVRNLVDNAVRHNRPNGLLTLTTATVPGGVLLHVANTGPSVPPQEAERLLEPFVRGSDSGAGSEGGAGLGLSIVRAVVVAHGGNVRVVARPGGGLKIDVRLPARAGAPASARPLPMCPDGDRDTARFTPP